MPGRTRKQVLWTRPIDGVMGETRLIKREVPLGLGHPDLITDQLWRIDWKKRGYPYCGVYVISTDSLNPCKIGISSNPTKRLTALQTSHWRHLQVSAYRWCETAIDAAKVERAAHKMLVEGGRALLGEWFDLRPTQAIEAIEMAAAIHNIRLHKHCPEELHTELKEIADVISYNNHMMQAVLSSSTRPQFYSDLM